VADRNTPQKLVWRSRICCCRQAGVGKMAIVRAVGKCSAQWIAGRRYVARGFPGCSGTQRVAAKASTRGIGDANGRSDDLA